MCDRTQTSKPLGSPSLALSNKTKLPERKEKNRQRGSILNKKSNAISLSLAAGSAVIIERFCPLPKCEKSSFLRKKDWIRHGETIATGDCSRTIWGWIENSRSRSEEIIAENKILENVLTTCARTIDNPPPPLVLIACISFAFAITAFRHSNQGDRYQDHIIGLAVVVGVAYSTVAGDFLLTLKALLPWSVILGLVLSSLAHRGRFWGLSSRAHDNRRVCTDDEYMEEMRAHREGMLAEKELRLDRRGSVTS